MAIIVIIIPANLFMNLLLSLFFPLIETKNKNQSFSKLVVWLQEIFLFFIYTGTLLQRYDFYKNIFLCVIPARIIVP